MSMAPEHTGQPSSTTRARQEPCRALDNTFFGASNYPGLDVRGYAYIPSLGISGVLTVTALALHTVWSISVPIALAAGATLTYAWHGFLQQPLAGSVGITKLLGNLVFAIGACVLLVVAARRVRTTPEARKPGDVGGHPPDTGRRGGDRGRRRP
jgi:hypothetical protein